MDRLVNVLRQLHEEIVHLNLLPEPAETALAGDHGVVAGDDAIDEFGELAAQIAERATRCRWASTAVIP